MPNRTLNRRWSPPLAAMFAALVASGLAAEAQARTILPAGAAAAWKYRDDGVTPGEQWKQSDFDDAAWKSGAAPLGFGEAGLTTVVDSGPADRPRHCTTWFRREFTASPLKPGERLVVWTCVDDGAIVYLNGREVVRLNMPAGDVAADTWAASTVGNDDEGKYERFVLADHGLSADGRNVLAVEVHQSTASSSDLYFDLALKATPVEPDLDEQSPAVRDVVDEFNKRHYLGPETKIPDGYFDGGRGMKIAADGDVSTGREILVLDRRADRELADELALARSPEFRALPELERAAKLAALIDRATTPPAGLKRVEAGASDLEKEFKGRPILIGDWVDQCQAGVCRHRALLFKALADEAGLRAALVRGNFAKAGPPGFPHAWNEIMLADGRRLLVDVMHNGGKPNFPPLDDPKVVERYLKVDDTPWYATAGR